MTRRSMADRAPDALTRITGICAESSYVAGESTETPIAVNRAPVLTLRSRRRQYGGPLPQLTCSGCTPGVVSRRPQRIQIGERLGEAVWGTDDPLALVGCDAWLRRLVVYNRIGSLRNLTQSRTVATCIAAYRALSRVQTARGSGHTMVKQTKEPRWQIESPMRERCDPYYRLGCF
jgi:hypothetical protein